MHVYAYALCVLFAKCLAEHLQQLTVVRYSIKIDNNKHIHISTLVVSYQILQCYMYICTYVQYTHKTHLKIGGLRVNKIRNIINDKIDQRC